MSSHPVEQHYRQRMREAAELADPSEVDYHAIDQGRYGTTLRHRAVLDAVRGIDGGHVLDLGCGTGLLLDAMIERGDRPSWYIGVDGIAERQFMVRQRLVKHDVKGTFIWKEMSKRFEDVSFPYVDVVLCVGVMGYWGYHTQRHVKSMFAKMERLGDHGAMTFPMIYGPNNMSGDYYRRWDVSDVTDLLKIPENQVVILEREVVIYW